MRSQSLFLTVAALVAGFPLVSFCTEYHSGDVSGTWTKANNPHIITAEVRVPPESTLVIEPGCQVLFRDCYKFIVDSAATLQAVGTTTDSILFDEETPGTGWHGVRMLQADSASAFSFCRFQHGKATGGGEDDNGGAVYSLGSDLRLSHCVLDTNFAQVDGGAVYCDHATLEIASCLFRKNNIGTGVGCPKGGALHGSFARVTIAGSTFSSNTGLHGAGIYLDNTPGTIADNLFDSNSSTENGAAIECDGCTLTIARNTFSANSAHGPYAEGGAVCVHFSQGVVISDNIFVANYGYCNGGALSCYATSGVVTGNLFVGNSTSPYEDGGALYWDSGTGSITENAFSSNSACNGGALFCLTSLPTRIERNTFSGNSAKYGGAICCWYSYTTPEIYNNTITANTATWGGGLFCNAASPILRNCILWGDTASTGQEVWLIEGAAPQLTYCDVAGGWQGEGNIDANPYFINAAEGVLQLQHSSVCIDAGDPASPLDPDSTRADMGACYFDQSVTPSIELYPYDTPIVLPPTGGSVGYDGWVYNLADTSVTVDIWTYAVLPNHSRYGPVRQYTNRRIRPHARVGMNNISESVPAVAPAGSYSYIGYVGRFQSSAWDSSFFAFSKSQ